MWVYFANYTSFQAARILIMMLVPCPLVDYCGNKYWVYLTNILYYNVYRYVWLVSQLDLVHGMAWHRIVLYSIVN